METVQQTYKDPQVKKGLPIYMVFVTHFVFLIGYPTGSTSGKRPIYLWHLCLTESRL